MESQHLQIKKKQKNDVTTKERQNKRKQKKEGEAQAHSKSTHLFSQLFSLPTMHHLFENFNFSECEKKFF